MFEVANRRVIVTGAAQGLGKEFVRRLLQEGCRVCVSDVDTTKGLETKSEFQKQFSLDNSGVCFVKCDVSVKEDWQELWDTAEKMLEGPIEILVNNAGVHPGHGWEKNLDINLYGVSRGCFMAIDRMGRSNGGRGGRIVNVASVAGFTNGGLGVIEHMGYNMAKHGVVALTKGFKFAEPTVYDTEGIKCYAIAPYYVDTNLVRSSFELSKDDPGKWSVRGQAIASMEDLQNSTKERLLTVTEVGAGLMKSLQYDQDGACYIIFPDCPLIDYPINQTLEFISVVLIAKRIAGHFRVELFTYKHLLAILLITFVLAYHLFLYLLSWIF